MRYLGCAAGLLCPAAYSLHNRCVAGRGALLLHGFAAPVCCFPCILKLVIPRFLGQNYLVLRWDHFVDYEYTPNINSTRGLYIYPLIHCSHVLDATMFGISQFLNGKTRIHERLPLEFCATYDYDRYFFCFILPLLNNFSRAGPRSTRVTPICPTAPPKTRCSSR